GLIESCCPAGRYTPQHNRGHAPLLAFSAAETDPGELLRPAPATPIQLGPISVGQAGQAVLLPYETLPCRTLSCMPAKPPSSTFPHLEGGLTQWANTRDIAMSRDIVVKAVSVSGRHHRRGELRLIRANKIGKRHPGHRCHSGGNGHAGQACPRIAAHGTDPRRDDVRFFVDGAADARIEEVAWLDGQFFASHDIANHVIGIPYAATIGRIEIFGTNIGLPVYPGGYRCLEGRLLFLLVDRLHVAKLLTNDDPGHDRHLIPISAAQQWPRAPEKSLIAQFRWGIPSFWQCPHS